MRTIVALAAFLALTPLAAGEAPRNSPDVMMDSDRAAAEELARFDGSAADLVAALRPAPGARYDDAGYRRNVYRTTLTTHPGVRDATAYDPLAPTAARRLALNDNHTRDLPAPFLTGDAEVTPAARVVLDVLGEALADPALASARYLIAVHTDTSGPAEVNAWLAEKRAGALIDDLVERHGIARSRLVAAGFGEAYPLAGVAGDSPRNRRLEVTLIEADDGTGDVVAAAPARPFGEELDEGADATVAAAAAAAARRGRALGVDAEVAARARGAALEARRAAAARRASIAEQRRVRRMAAEFAAADRYAAAGGEVPEAVVDASGRIVGARIVAPYRPGRRLRRVPCSPFGCRP